MLLQLLYQAALDPHRRIHTNKKDVFISTETKMTKVNQLHYTQCYPRASGVEPMLLAGPLSHSAREFLEKEATLFFTERLATLRDSAF